MRTTLLALAAAPWIAAAALAQQPVTPPTSPAAPAAPMAPAGDSSALEGLGLTPKQREKIRAIREETRQANAPLRDQARQLMGGRMYRDLTPTEQDSLRPKLEPIRQAMMANVRKGRYQIEAILTAEQREKFHQLMGRGEAPGGPPEN